MEIIEDIIPIHNTYASIMFDKKADSVTLFPQNRKIRFEQKDGRVEFNIDEFECHQWYDKSKINVKGGSF